MGATPPLNASQEQSAVGRPPYQHSGKRAASSTEEPAGPPTKRIRPGSDMPYRADDMSASELGSPPCRPRSAGFPLTILPVAVSQALQPTTAAEEPKRQFCHLSSVVTARSSAPPSIGSQLSSSTAGLDRCASHGAAVTDMPDA